MKIALFGGTFDPVHKGHVRAAQSVLQFTDCEEVWFVPVYWHVYKAKGKVTGISHRKRMLELAIDGRPGLRVVDLNENPTYTIDTIRKAGLKFRGNEYVWVIGSDLVPEFHTWRDAGDIVRGTKIIVVPEPGFSRIESPLLSEEKGNCIVLLHAPRIDLDSTRVREKIGRREDVSGLVDPKVLQYAKENQLYTE